MISSRLQACSYSQNGLESQRKIKKFEIYKGWRDPDLANKPRNRSIPNPIKRFLNEFKVSPPKLIESRVYDLRPRKTEELEFPSSTISSSSDFSPKVVQVFQADSKQKHEKPVNTCKPTGGAIRCALCDYPYDSTKRRSPPHMFTPTVVNLPMNFKNRGMKSSKSEMVGYLNFAGQAKRKVTRLKRKRSSTELYGGMVAV